MAFRAACIVAATLSGATALRVGAAPAPRASVSMSTISDLMAQSDPAIIAPPVAEESVPSASNAAESDCFFGGGGGVPEGAKCVFRGDACTRKRCKVNGGPCKNNHASK
jgi:hypothetical protein